MTIKDNKIRACPHCGGDAHDGPCWTRTPEDAVERVKRAIAPLLNDDMDGDMLDAWLSDLARTAIAAIQPPPVQEAGELVTKLRCFVRGTEGNLTFMRHPTADLILEAADRIQALEADNARLREATETRSVPTMDATWSAGWNCAMEFVRKATLKGETPGV